MPVTLSGKLPVRACDEVHGFENTCDIEFEYLSVTSPPVNFRGAYAKQWQWCPVIVSTWPSTVSFAYPLGQVMFVVGRE
jgi:hypothetical protein